MNEPVTDLKKFNLGDVLAHPRGATAIVREVIMHNHDKHKQYGYRLEITQESGKVQTASVPLHMFGGKGWRLHMTAEQAAATEPAKPTVTVEQVASLMTPPAIAEIEIAEPVISTEPPDDSPADDLRKKYAGYVERSDEARMSHLAYTDWLETTLIATQEWEDQRAIRLEAQLEDVRTARDSAIETATEASNDAARLAQRNIELEEQLAAAQAATRPVQRDLSTAPSKEFNLVTKALAGDLARMDKDGWLVEYMQFNEPGDLRVVYYRYVDAPASPEPERAAVTTTATQPVNPAVIPYQMPESVVDLEAARNELESHLTRSIDNIPLQSPPGRFNRMLNKAFDEGNQAYINFLQENPLTPHTAIPLQGVQS